MVCRSSRDSVCSASWERCPLWPPRYTNSIRGAPAPAVTAATPGSPPDCGEAQLSPSPSWEATSTAELPGSMRDPRTTRSAPHLVTLPCSLLGTSAGVGPAVPSWSGPWAHPVRGLRRGVLARRRPRAIAPGHSKAPPAGKDRGASSYPGSNAWFRCGGVELVTGVLGQQHDSGLVHVRRQRPQRGHQPAPGSASGCRPRPARPRAAGCHACTASG